ncbi:MAG: hypothetical protein P4M15_08840 [Alphaproteobacteria bacterium]|nr:hypothetical protein [Alphaproteobacteria bacterium]
MDLPDKTKLGPLPADATFADKILRLTITVLHVVDQAKMKEVFYTGKSAYRPLYYNRCLVSWYAINNFVDKDDPISKRKQISEMAALLHCAEETIKLGAKEIDELLAYGHADESALIKKALIGIEQNFDRLSLRPGEDSMLATFLAPVAARKTAQASAPAAPSAKTKPDKIEPAPVAENIKDIRKGDSGNISQTPPIYAPEGRAPMPIPSHFATPAIPRTDRELSSFSRLTAADRVVFESRNLKTFTELHALKELKSFSKEELQCYLDGKPLPGIRSDVVRMARMRQIRIALDSIKQQRPATRPSPDHRQKIAAAAQLHKNRRD